jgi:hypothetical protein
VLGGRPAGETACAPWAWQAGYRYEVSARWRPRVYGWPVLFLECTLARHTKDSWRAWAWQAKLIVGALPGMARALGCSRAVRGTH